MKEEVSSPEIGQGREGRERLRPGGERLHDPEPVPVRERFEEIPDQDLAREVRDGRRSLPALPVDPERAHQFDLFLKETVRLGKAGGTGVELPPLPHLREPVAVGPDDLLAHLPVPDMLRGGLEELVERGVTPLTHRAVPDHPFPEPLVGVGEVLLDEDVCILPAEPAEDRFNVLPVRMLGEPPEFAPEAGNLGPDLPDLPLVGLLILAGPIGTGPRMVMGL